MLDYDVILFDLAGTLIDSGPGILKSAAYALEKQNIHVEDLTELNCFIGPPLMDSFMDFYHMTEKEARKAVKDYRQLYCQQGMYDNKVYEGIPQVLKALKDAGKTLLVTTSKPEALAKPILEKAGLAGYFDLIAGALMDETRGKKSEVIAYALETLGISRQDRRRMVLVGDRKYDVLGAKSLDIDCIGVLYGYGDREELENAGAKYIAACEEEITALLLG